ncbi:hypothetical protein F4802DRAFT_593905 [Xylaria palmicola]|nr:hypothetical protein F4802DRAFT_593905 [Xylaria palmicola]
MTTRLPALLHPQDAQRQACPDHISFYHCGGFRGCCAVDPCGYLDNTDPCKAAIADLEGQDGDGGVADTSSTERHTSTLPPRPSSVISTNTSGVTGSGTSAAETRSSSSVASLPLTSSAETPTTVDHTTFITDTSAIATTITLTTLPTPSQEDSGDSSGNGPLSGAAVAGISVGGVAGGTALCLLLFWLLRRHRLSKRMSSVRGDESPSPGGKSRRSLTGTALGTGVFSRFSSLGAPDRHDEGWPLCSSGSGTGASQLGSQQHAGPRPAYAELDSTEMARLAPGPGPRSPPRRPVPPGRPIHPSQLTPGYHGAVPRATLNATDEERVNNLYANSWAQGP